MRLFLLAAPLLVGAPALAAADQGTPPPTGAGSAPARYLDPTLPVGDRVADLLGRMTLEDKLGQMTLVDRSVLGNERDLATHRLGAVFNGGSSAPTPNRAASWADTIDSLQRTAATTPLGIPILYGANAVHGHNGLWGATVFPHAIGLGATRDPALVGAVGRAVAEELAGTGVNWNFAPCACVVRNDRWGRTYESFGETPEIVTPLVGAFIAGQQDGDPAVLTSAKHYLGDGGTAGGTDQGDAVLSEAELRAVHLPPFQEAVARGVGSIMVSFSSWNGVRLHAHRYLLTDVLKDELGFAGFVVSDWAAVDRIDGRSGLTAAEVRTAVDAGLDMVMVPYDFRLFLSLLRSEVLAGRIPMSRIDDANRRILTQKFRLGLFEQRLVDRRWTATVGSAEHRALARRAVQASLVVLRNDGVLPLTHDGGALFVAGRAADDIGIQSGGWTMSWQGGAGAITPGTTVLDALRAAAGPATTVAYEPDGFGIDRRYRAAIAVVGELPYAEGVGDRPAAMGLDAGDLAMLARLRASGVPLVVVLVSGRPLDIAEHIDGWDALVAAWLPGTEGAGVADVLFGDVDATGTLPVTWMRSADQQPINEGDGKVPLFPLGAGAAPLRREEPAPPSLS